MIEPVHVAIFAWIAGLVILFARGLSLRNLALVAVGYGLFLGAMAAAPNVAGLVPLGFIAGVLVQKGEDSERALRAARLRESVEKSVEAAAR